MVTGTRGHFETHSIEKNLGPQYCQGMAEKRQSLKIQLLKRFNMVITPLL